ncbi:MAG: hypothetical protein ABIG64_04120 [Candidatus Omnitrophota bacterium]
MGKGVNLKQRMGLELILGMIIGILGFNALIIVLPIYAQEETVITEDINQTENQEESDALSDYPQEDVSIDEDLGEEVNVEVTGNEDFDFENYNQEDTLINEDIAEEVTEEESAKPKDIFDLVIPSSWGSIKEIYKGNSEEVIVHIQDAHRNYEAQTNIENILSLLVDEYGLIVAGLEAGVGKLNTDIFSTFPDEDIRVQATDFFVRDGRMTGAEALVTKQGFEYPLKLYGIEDPDLYANNYKALHTSLPFKEEAKGYFSALNLYLMQIKSKIYNEALKQVDQKQIAFETGNMQLNDYALFLLEQMEELKIKIKEAENFNRLTKAIKLEKSIDFTKAEAERTSLLTELTNILPEEDIRTLLDKGMAYKNERISASVYLQFVKDLALKHKIDFEQYKNLDNYINYALNYDQIKSVKLFDEIDSLQDQIRLALYNDEVQKKLDLYVKGLKVMERLVDIKMVNKDLSFYKENQELLKTDNFIAFIKEQAKSLGMSVNISPEISYIDVYIPAWVDFYQVAALRDQAMIDNIMKIIKENQQKIGAMVTGGFHTRALTEIMKQKEISYLVITPRITENVEGPYFGIITGTRKTVLDKLVEELEKTRSN